MTPPTPLDLLVIGALTVDRFDDGSSSPGGTVMHAARALAPRGLRLGVVTAAGAEPEAKAGLAELRRIAPVVVCRPLDDSVTFRHRDSDEGRRLWLERAGGSVAVDADVNQRLGTRKVLFGPVLDEIPTDLLAGWANGDARGAILQGWLRGPEEGAEVRPLPLAAVGSRVVDALARFDVLVASREDLVAEAPEPRDQLAGLRRAFGGRPHLVLTNGVHDLWHDAPRRGSAINHYPVPRRPDVTSTVGAGDILAALLIATFPPAPHADAAWIGEAMRAVGEALAARSG